MTETRRAKNEATKKKKMKAYIRWNLMLYAKDGCLKTEEEYRQQHPDGQHWFHSGGRHCKSKKRMDR